jgi:CheY-like chemotaxis protein
MQKGFPHMNLTIELAAVRDQDLPVVERASLACRLAKKLETTGEYEAAYEALSEFWPDRSESPALENLDEATKAKVLLRVGALTGWLGGTTQTLSQETAKNFITSSIEIFEAQGDTVGSAEAHKDLAICYWREGAFEEARIHLREALKSYRDNDRLELRAVILIWYGLVEADAGRLHEALRRYDEAAPLVEKIEDHWIKGTFHAQFGMAFRRLATPENREDYFDRALIEYAAASFHFEQVGNVRALARLENNLGFLYFAIGRYRDAHEHLNRARSLFLQLKDLAAAVYVDETRARTFLAEGRLREAERMIKSAVKVLERGGQQALLAGALTTYGAITARMGNHARATYLLQRAIDVAETAGDRQGSGCAHLTIVEELGGHTPLKQLAEIYTSAIELLDRSQDPATNKRLVAGARTVIDALLANESRDVSAPEVTSWDGFSLRREVRKIEKLLIERALRDGGGSVTKASQLLGFKHHQSLIGLINSRHRDLLTQRSVVRRRRHHLFSQPKRTKRKAAPGKAANQLSVLHVEDHKPVARMVKDVLGADYHVQSYANGVTALDLLKTETPVDALIVDNNLPGISGLELVLRTRSLSHRRNLPIIMLSGDNVEKEAWRAGVDAFVEKAQAADQLPSTLARVIASAAEPSE